LDQEKEIAELTESKRSLQIQLDLESKAHAELQKKYKQDVEDVNEELRKLRSRVSIHLSSFDSFIPHCAETLR
jgi:predicted  nucleic acid-binding Zn-ribbon protein